MPESEFAALLRRVRAGDAAAAAELVRRYEPVIRRTVRLRLRDPRLRRELDSMDICQSVLGKFFVRAALGQFDLERSDDLLALLVTMARNKLATVARKPAVARRDPRPLGAGDADGLDRADSTLGPVERAAKMDLVAAVRRRLSPEEARLADLRAQGRAWADIAAEMGADPEALRKKLTRALDRVAAELGLDGP